MQFDKKYIKKFLPSFIYFWLRILYNFWLRICRNVLKYKSVKYKIQGFYLFKLKYFGKWERVKLNHYFDWQLRGPNDNTSAVEISIDEYKALKSILVKRFPKGPKIVMDFGCGLGRSSVFFKNMLKWHSTKFILVDGHQNVYGTSDNIIHSQTSFHHDIKNLEGSFYTNFDFIERFLLSNNVSIYNLIDLKKNKYKLSLIKDIDLFYSFHSIGYHYDILRTFDYYKIDNCLQPGALLIFGIRRKHDLLRNELIIDNFIQRGYKKLKIIEGHYSQDFLLMEKL